MRTTRAETGKPVGLLKRKADREVLPIGMQVRDVKASECSSVMDGIRVSTSLDAKAC
jgi:hypothetical protein